MKKAYSFFIISLSMVGICLAEEVDLFIIAGQSNAQGWAGDATQYPDDPLGLDQSIRFYWVTPGFSSSGGKWVTLRGQGGRFKNGHFGLEVTFARSLKEAGFNPAIFKYSLGSTSLAGNWKGPGDGGIYDQMVGELDKARSLLEEEGHAVIIRGFVWIQGESDAETHIMADGYRERLRRLIHDLRHNITRNRQLITILGVDEQHPWVQRNSQVVEAQKELAKGDGHAIFTTMVGLEKADGTHLTPKGLEEHGWRVFAAYKEITKGQRIEDSTDRK